MAINLRLHCYNYFLSQCFQSFEQVVYFYLNLFESFVPFEVHLRMMRVMFDTLLAQLSVVGALRRDTNKFDRLLMFIAWIYYSGGSQILDHCTADFLKQIKRE